MRVAVVGGSIAGCAVAVDLLHHGHEVSVFERSTGALSDRGAGILTQDPVLEKMKDRELLSADFPACPVDAIRYIAKGEGPDGWRWIGDVRMDLAAINWSHLFHDLRARVPDERYHAGNNVSAIGGGVDHATITLANDTPDRSVDLVVAADGYRSGGRRVVAPDAALSYIGVVFWRGLLPESEVNADPLLSRVTRIVYPGGHGAVYLIPSADRSTEPCRRLVMWGFYLAVTADDLAALLVDEDGHAHDGSIPFGQVRPDVELDFRNRLLPILPQYFADLIEATSSSSIQAIYSVQIAEYVRGRACVIGDAGTVFPPFTGSGVFKAIDNATSLADAVSVGQDVDAALAGWSAAQEKAASTIMPLSERSARALAFDVPDIPAMSFADTNAWLTDLHAGADLNLPDL